MALVLKENLLNYAEYAVWKIEEEPEFYRAGLILSEWESNYLNNITHPKRQLTWLASRYLLKQLIDTDVFVELLFDEHGKPFVKNFDIFVSLSHSNEHAAAIVSKQYEVGIDVETPNRNIEIIKNKFLSEVEIKNIGDKQVQEQLLIYWSAKEVIYKIYGKRKLEFKDDMYVKPFLLKQRGDLDGMLMKNGYIADYHLHYILNNQFTLVVGAEKEVSIIEQP
jgi:4'-phosphopantetheinyl transferase